MNNKEMTSYFQDLHTLETLKYSCKKLIELYQSCIEELRLPDNILKDYELFAGEICPPEEYNKTIPSLLELTEYLEYKADTDPTFDAAYYTHLKAPLRWWHRDLAPICESAENSGAHLRNIICILLIIIGILTRNLYLLFLFIAVIMILLTLYHPKIRKGTTAYLLLLDAYASNYETELARKLSYAPVKLDYLLKEYEEQLLPFWEAVCTLQKRMYASNIVPEKYQNHMAITQIYQYITDCRCTTPKEAYRLYEKELHLGTTSSSMSVLGTALPSIEPLMNDVRNQLAVLAPNTALTSYCESGVVILNELQRKYGDC